MKRLCLTVAFFASLTGFAMAGQTAPPPASADASLVIQIRGCHADARRHYVPEFGRRVTHFHRQRNCRPVRAQAPRRVCHRNVQVHRHGGVRLRHRHVGPNCAVRIVRRMGS